MNRRLFLSRLAATTVAAAIPAAVQAQGERSVWIRTYALRMTFQYDRDTGLIRIGGWSWYVEPVPGTPDDRDTGLIRIGDWSWYIEPVPGTPDP